MITENTLRVKIETTGDGQLKASLDGATQSVTQLDAAQQAQAETAAKATTAQQANIEATTAVGAAAEATAAQVAAAAAIGIETADQQTARIKTMVAASLEQQAANAAVAESETSILERAGLRTEMSTAERTAILANAEATRAKVAADMEVIAAEEGVATATAATTAETEVQAAAFALNSRSMAEVSTITSDVVSGQFGRIRRSLAALANTSGAIGLIFSPLGLLAGAIAAVGVAAYKGEEQESALNDAIISTGGYAGVTAGQLNAMAESMAGGTVTIGRARAAVDALTESGRFTGEQIAKLAQATVDGGTLMGKSVKQMVDEFTQLQESPVAASEKLNQATHYLTTAVLQQIVALQQQGDAIAAGNLAMMAWADSLRTRTAAAENQLGTLQRAWDSVKSSASFAWDAMLGIGRPSTDLSRVNDQYDALLKQRMAVAEVAAGNKPGVMDYAHLPDSLANEASGAWGGGPGAKAQADAKALLAKLDAELAQMRAAMKPIEDASSGAAAASGVAQDVQAAGAQGVETLTRLGISLDGLKSKQDKVNAAAAAFYAIHLAGGKLPPGIDFNGPTADTPEGSGWDKIKAGLLGPKKKNPATAAYSAFQSQVDTLSTSSLTADDAALTRYEQGIAKLADEMAVYMSKGGDATKAADEFNRGQQALQKTLDANHVREIDAENQYKAALDKKNAALQLSINNQVASVGMGAKEFQQSQQITQAYQDEADALASLALQRQQGMDGQAGGLSQAAYEADVQALKNATAQKVSIIQDGYKRMDAAQADWTNGAKAALQDYADQAKNVAGQVSQGFGAMSTDMENSLVAWEQGGKLTLKSFEADFENMLAHMVTKALIAQAETALISMFSGGGSIGGGSTYDLGGLGSSYSSDMASVGGGSYPTLGGHADGGPIRGPGTGKSDSILARLSNGEYVQPDDAVSYYGEKFMDDVRAKRLPRYAQGGPVGSPSGGGFSSGAGVVVNMYNAPQGSTVQQSSGSDGSQIIDVFINAAAQDVARGGRLGQAMQSAFGVRRQARSYAVAGG